MRVLVNQRTAAFALPGRTPTAAVVITLRTIPVGYNPDKLFDMTELMMECYDSPDEVAVLLTKVTEFLINYLKAFKKAGAELQLSSANVE